jgi:hypothetical protein
VVTTRRRQPQGDRHFVRDRSPAERAAIPVIGPDSEPGEYRRSRTARGTRDSDSGDRRSDVLHDPEREFALCSGLHRQAHRWNDERFHRRGSERRPPCHTPVAHRLSRCEYGTTVRAGCAHELLDATHALTHPDVVDRFQPQERAVLLQSTAVKQARSPITSAVRPAARRRGRATRLHLSAAFETKGLIGTQ